MVNSRAAVWRDRDGRVVKTTSDEFYCLNPRPTRDLAARTDDGEYETTLRCRDCANCRRYEERRLRQELAETYKGVTDELWIVTVEADLAEHSRLAARIRRSRVGRFEPALYRVGAAAFALVARGERPALQRVRALRARTYRVAPLGRERRPRAFRALTRGLLVARESYGAWANRFYHRGRLRLPHAQFVIEKRGGIRKRHPEARSGVRAWKRGTWLDASVRTQALSAVSELLAAERAQGDRNCTHLRCTGKRCRLAARAMGARLSGAEVEAMALILKRDGHLNGRKCTHSKCPPDRCLYAQRTKGANSSINQPPRASAASVSLNDRISDCTAGGVAGVGGGSEIVRDRKPPAVRPSILRLGEALASKGRDAGSPQVKDKRLRAQLQRWVEKGWLKPTDTT